MEDIHWIAKCANLQQEIDMLNERLANASLIEWKTGKPKEEGSYIVTIRARFCIDVAYSYYDNINGWSHWNDIIAWCKIIDIEPYKEERK